MTDWFGHRINPAPVIYVMLEGAGGLKKRIAALEQKLGHPLPDLFGVIVQPFKLNHPLDVDALIDAVPKGAVVFIDTLNRAAPDADENSSKDMGEILEGAKRLADATEGLVLLVHHTGKDQKKGLRGHSSLHAALDAAIEVVRKDDQRAWRVAKSKDDEDGMLTPFRLQRRVVGSDADGDEISSCTVEWDQAALFKRPEPQGKNQKAAFQALRNALRSGGMTALGVAGSDANTPCLKQDDAVVVVAETLTDKPMNKRAYEAKRLIKALQDSGHLQAGQNDDGEDWIW